MFHSLLRRAKIGAAIATLLVAQGCTIGTNSDDLAITPKYADVLQGINNLAYSTTENPPRAALASSAYAAAILRTFGEPINKDEKFWEPLISASGEDDLWVAYYGCLASNNNPQAIKSFGVDPRNLSLKQSDDSSKTFDANAALEELTTRLVSQCLNKSSSKTQIRVVEDDSIIIRARLKKAGYAADTNPIASRGEIENVSQLIREQGCNDWNQASAWALNTLNGTQLPPEINDCKNSTQVQVQEPAALYTSMELGLPTSSAEKIAPVDSLKVWLSDDWQTRKEGSEPRGYGNLENTVQLVELYSQKGWKIPDWIGKGVLASAAQDEGYNANLAYLCSVLTLKCPAYVMKGQPPMEQVGRMVLDGTLDDTSGRYAALAALERSNVATGLCTGNEEALFKRAPQTFSALANVDEDCWQALSLTPDTIVQKVTSNLADGKLEDARAYLQIAGPAFGALDVKESILPPVQQAWDTLMKQIEEKYGQDYLARTKPLALVLFSSELEFWK